jgi:hypothetical protein
MSMVFIGSILIIFGYSEAYGQTMASINPNFQVPSNTSVIAMAFVNLTLKDIQDYKEVLKSELSDHINDTIDNLATGRGFNFSICSTSEYRFELPCPLINGIIIPPQNLTTVK